MSDMTGNPDYVPELMDSPDARSIPTLLGALAYEQRTANLIAAFNSLADPEGDLTFLGEGVDGLNLAHTIRARLGLDTP